MLRKSIPVIVSYLLSASLYAAECNLSDEDFPISTCSFTDLDINAQTLRFGRLDRVISSGTIIRSGINLYVIDDEVEIYDTRDINCNFNDDSLDSGDENSEIAFILDGDSLRAPRVINTMWILNCEVSQTR